MPCTDPGEVGAGARAAPTIDDPRAPRASVAPATPPAGGVASAGTLAAAAFAKAPLAALLAASALVACSGRSDRAPGETAGHTASTVPSAALPPAATAPAGARENPPPPGAMTVVLPAPKTVRTWGEVRRQAAERLVAANPSITYTGRVPEPLLAIPVLEVELNGDGSIRRIEVLREPREAKDTLKIAVDAVRRAAPFGDVSKLPRPWKFAETFLFDDARKFKPRTLDR